MPSPHDTAALASPRYAVAIKARFLAHLKGNREAYAVACEAVKLIPLVEKLAYDRALAAQFSQRDWEKSAAVAKHSVAGRKAHQTRLRNVASKRDETILHFTCQIRD